MNAVAGDSNKEKGQEEEEEEAVPLKLIDVEHNGAARLLCVLLSASHNDVFLRPQSSGA